MPIQETAHGPSTKTASADALATAIAEHLPGLVGVEVKHRLGERGRFSSRGFEWTREKGETPTADGVMAELVAAAELVDHREGPGCWFSATVIVMLSDSDELRTVGPYKFQLDPDSEGDGVRDDMRMSMQHTARHLRQLEGMNMRAFGYIEQLVTQSVKQSEACAAMAGPMVEMKRLEYDRTDAAAERAEEARAAERTHELVKEFGPKLLLIMGAQRAQTAEREANPNAEPLPIWERLRDAVAVIVKRDNVRAVLTPDGVAIAEALAVADNQATAETLVRRLVALGLDPFDLIAVAPELKPFAHLLAGL